MYIHIYDDMYIHIYDEPTWVQTDASSSSTGATVPHSANDRLMTFFSNLHQNASLGLTIYIYSLDRISSLLFALCGRAVSRQTACAVCDCISVLATEYLLSLYIFSNICVFSTVSFAVFVHTPVAS